jgi:hypothetical protein
VIAPCVNWANQTVNQAENLQPWHGPDRGSKPARFSEMPKPHHRRAEFSPYRSCSRTALAVSHRLFGYSAIGYWQRA